MFAATLPDPRIGALLSSTERDGRVGTSLPTAVLALLGADADRAPRSSRRSRATCSACGRQALRTVAEVGPRRAGRRTADALAKASGRTRSWPSAGKSRRSMPRATIIPDGHDKTVYEAVLSAAPEMPDEVAQLCLELAQRRDLDPAIVARVEQAHERQREQRRQFLEAESGKTEEVVVSSGLAARRAA